MAVPDAGADYPPHYAETAITASLPMYDWPEVRDQTDAFWQRIGASLTGKGIAAPEALDRGDRLEALWRDPGLVLGQTCGLPLVRGEAGTAVPVARPTYPVEGCGPGTYSSVLLARRGTGATLADFHNRPIAINGWNSQSGCNALKDAYFDALSEGPVFASVLVTGAHRASADAVAAGQADLCALDAVAWALYQWAEPERAAALAPIFWTRPMPSLPYITAQKHGDHLADLAAALSEAANGAGPAVPSEILPATRADYDPVRDMDQKLKAVTLAPQPSV